jgi:arylsulfatase A-like enzyme
MPRRAVVLSFDQLHLGFLGCYGNDWMETPNLDRLATQGVVFDRHFAENVDPAAVNHAWWTGRYQSLVPPDAQQDQETFLPALESAGVRTALIVEADGRDSASVAPPFEEVIEVRGVDRLGGEEGETPFARLVIRAGEWLQEAAGEERPRLLWLKSRGVPAPWLPPLEFGDLYLDEFGLGEGAAAGEDDDGSDGPEDESDSAEKQELPAEDGPRAGPPSPEAEAALELKYARALYAAYVSWLDRWTGKLLRTLEAAPGWDETLLIVTAGAGQGLGEHAPLAEKALLLRDELMHTLLIVRVPDGGHEGTRRAALVQTVDLPATLVDWFGVGREGASSAGAETVEGSGDKALAEKSLLAIVRNECDAVRDFALLRTTDEWGLRTDDFLYVAPQDPEQMARHSAALLFEKPHDRWDHADVSSQYPHCVEELHARLLYFARSAMRDQVSGGRHQAPAAPPVS